MRRLRAHLTYANIMASLAVFIALGGTSYALTALPRNSVGTKQIRSNAVGASELRSNAVRSKDVKNRALGLRDLSLGARRSLRGQQGPPGPQGPVGAAGSSLTAAVNAAGVVTRSIGGATGSNRSDGLYEVRFSRGVQDCYAVASLSRVEGAPPEDPDRGEIVTSNNKDVVTVRTRNSSGAVANLPFHLIVVC